MFEGSLENVRHDLHVAMRVGSEALTGLYPVFVDDAKRPKAHVAGVEIVGEREGVAGVEPPMVGSTSLAGRSDSQHGAIILASEGQALGHDAHFLQRLDRVGHEHVELSLGLYRDHELVRFILSHVRLPEGAERVALRLAESDPSPHVVVARSGAFVTCLGASMSTGDLPVVPRAQLDALADKFQRIREGLDIARKRGFDETRLLARIESAGPAVAREDFVAAHAMLGPAAPLLFGVYASWAKTVEDLQDLLYTVHGKAAPKKDRAEIALARGAWALAHSSTILVDSASREWVREWASFPVLERASAWSLLTKQCAMPFVVRAAWLTGRLGKPVLASYKGRYVEPSHPLDLREAGWGLVALGLRHSALRSEVFRFLRSPPEGFEALHPAVTSSYRTFAETARLLDEKQDALREEAMDFGRKIIVEHTRDIDSSSPFRFTDVSKVPDDLALPGVLGTWYDAHNGPRGNDVMLLAMVVGASARAEDFYYPAAMLRDVPPDDMEPMGESLAEMYWTLKGPHEPVRREARPGRNEPCPCGSGKKYKKCHGA